MATRSTLQGTHTGLGPYGPPTGRRIFLVGGSLALVISTVGIWLLPDAGWAWAVILGMGMGTLFPITLTLPLDISSSAAEVAGATALVLGAGYLASASSPFLMGVMRDLAGSFQPVILFSVVLGVASLLVSFLMAEMKIGDRPEPATQA